MLSKRPYFNIFETIKTRDGWSVQIPLAELSKDNNYLHPTVSPDGQILAFSSDLLSEDGSTDIYLCYRTQLGVWSEPEFMKMINTDEMEITPKFHTNDTLYFSSNGLSGPGGYDIFYSTRRNDGTWTKPNPLNEINSQYNESDFTVLPDYRAVFASNRPGGRGGYDLFLTSYYWEENKLPPDRNLDISIATQIVNIKTMSDFTYEYNSLPNAFLSDDKPSEIDLMLAKSDGSYEFNGKIDNDYLAGLNLIAIRLNENADSKLFVNYVILETDNKDIKLPNSLELANRIKKYLLNTWGINDNRIELIKKVLKVSGSELLSFPVVFFNSDNPKIFKPLESGLKKISTDPPFSDIFIKIKPSETLSSAIAYVNLGSNKIIFSKYFDTATENFSIPLNDNSNDLVKTDSLLINIHAVNKFGDTITKSMQFDITHTESKKIKRLTIDGNDYEQINLFVPELDSDNLPVYLKETINLVVETAAFTKSIKVQFYSLLAQRKALNLYSILKKEINLPGLKIEPEQLQFNDETGFSRRFAPYIIRILMEKP
jgi:hypothetical protein